MKFYLSLTDENGTVIDRFRLEVDGNPDDECVGEDSEMVGGSLAYINASDLARRLERAAKQELKSKKA